MLIADGELYYMEFNALCSSAADGLIQALLQGWDLGDRETWLHSVIYMKKLPATVYGPGWYNVVSVV